MAIGDRIPLLDMTGDIKDSIRTSDHSGWVLLNGRLKTTLSPAQQAVATELGIGSNLYDARDKLLMGASDTKAIGSTGGDNTIARKNLPNEGLDFSGTSAANNRGHTHKVDPPSTTSGNQSAGHTHTIPELSGSTTRESATSGSSQVPIASFGWTADWGSDQGGSGRTFPYVSGSRTVSSSTLTHSHNVTTTADTTGGISANHTHTVDIAEFDSKSESQNHTHTYSGTTQSMNGGVTQEDHIPEYLAVNKFIYLGL